MTKHKRHTDDHYRTPDWCALVGVHALANALAAQRLPGVDTKSHLVYDPCVGTGVFPRVARERGHRWNWLEGDINPGYVENPANFLTAPARHDVSAIIANPPYSLALEFAERSLMMTSTVVMLLRLGFLETKRRYHFNRRYRADVIVLPKRPSFTGDGKTDGAAYGWFVWSEGSTGRIHIADYPKVVNVAPF